MGRRSWSVKRVKSAVVAFNCFACFTAPIASHAPPTTAEEEVPPIGTHPSTDSQDEGSNVGNPHTTLSAPYTSRAPCAECVPEASGICPPATIQSKFAASTPEMHSTPCIFPRLSTSTEPVQDRPVEVLQTDFSQLTRPRPRRRRGGRKHQ